MRLNRLPFWFSVARRCWQLTITFVDWFNSLSASRALVIHYGDLDRYFVSFPISYLRFAARSENSENLFMSYLWCYVHDQRGLYNALYNLRTFVIRLVRAICRWRVKSENMTSQRKNQPNFCTMVVVMYSWSKFKTFARALWTNASWMTLMIQSTKSMSSWNKV
jgi:hypothetical protein